MSPANEGRGHEPSRHLGWLVLWHVGPWLIVALFTFMVLA